MQKALLPSSFNDVLKVLTILPVLIASIWGIVKWEDNNHKEIESRRLEAAKPFLNKQLAFYIRATELTSQLATHFNEADNFKRTNDSLEFWNYYYGKLALVENRDVEIAMVQFGAELANTHPEADALRDLALNVAHACRSSLDKSWNINAWATPDMASK